MWQWLSVLAFVISSSPALAASTSTGPTSSAESEILWTDGKALFSQHKYQDAIPMLQRLVDRYPAHPGFLESQEMLGKAAMETGKPAQAIGPLKYLAEAARDPRQSVEATLLLGLAYERTGKQHEAQLLALEALKKSEKLSAIEKTAPQAAGLLLHARVLMNLKQDERAKMQLSSAEKLLQAAPSPELSGELAFLKLRHKTRECARYPTPGHLKEDQIRDQLERRGNCLLEALLLTRTALATPKETQHAQSLDEIQKAMSGYAKACSNPPPPPGKRNARQLRSYKNELKDLLKKDCRQKFTAASELISQWKEPVPAALKKNVESHL